MCPSHAELGVLVDDTVVRRLGWSGVNESDDYVRQNYDNYRQPEYQIILTLTRLKATHASDGCLHA
jgi:hypothetical protein